MLATILYTQPIRRLGAFFVLTFLGLNIGLSQVTVDYFL